MTASSVFDVVGAVREKERVLWLWTRAPGAAILGAEDRQSGVFTMEPIRTAAGLVTDRPLRAVTPESATWDVHEDAEIELIGDREPFDEVDVVDESWAPGQPPPGMPIEEVLHVHSYMERERSVDDLDVDEITQELLAISPDELFAGEDDE